MDPNYHAKIDDSDFLTGDDISNYRMMVGSLNWLVILGCCDIHYTVCTIAQHMMMPRQRHLHTMRRAFGYLKQNYKFSIDYDIKEPDFTIHMIEEHNWFPLNDNATEEEPYGMPEPKETITYESDIVAGHIAVDLAVELRYNLRMLGAP
eukprot:8156524-Ditylum_brightwellii.AAC.1